MELFSIIREDERRCEFKAICVFVSSYSHKKSASCNSSRHGKQTESLIGEEARSCPAKSSLNPTCSMACFPYSSTIDRYQATTSATRQPATIGRGLVLALARPIEGAGVQELCSCSLNWIDYLSIQCYIPVPV